MRPECCQPRESTKAGAVPSVTHDWCLDLMTTRGQQRGSALGHLRFGNDRSVVAEVPPHVRLQRLALN
jgi:hypothetical protein